MRLLLLTVILAATPLVQGDILHLRDGSRHYGELISQNEREIVFRVVLGDSSSTVARTFPAALVERVERTGRLQSRPAAPADQSAGPAAGANYEQMLREAFELLDDRDLPAALRALQRVVLEVPAARLERLDEQCRAARGVPLDELLAGTRLRVAAATRDGRDFKLKYVTPYERAALGRLLAEQQRALLARRHDGRSVAQWAGDWSDYTAVRPGARQLVADAARAAAVIAARLRLDPQIEGGRAERTRLVQLREDLSRLAAHVLALPGYTVPTDGDDAPDPTRDAAEKLAAQPAATSQPADAENPPQNADPTRPEEDQP